MRLIFKNTTPVFLTCFIFLIVVKTHMNVSGIFKCDFSGANTLSKHSPRWCWTPHLLLRRPWECTGGE